MGILLAICPLNMKPSFASRSSTDSFALFSTQVMELYKESWANRQTVDFTLKLV